MFFKLFPVLIFVPAIAFSADLRIFSFNTCMLPKPIKKTLQEVRKKVIPQQLKNSNYDLLVFQEAFTGDFHQDLISALKKTYPYNYYLNKENPVYPVFGSGVFLMSRYPFTVLKKVHYDECSHADCFAGKGVVAIELKLPSGKTVQVAATHLNAHDTDVKIAQFREIKKLLGEVRKPGVPQVLVGDLNSDPQSIEFSTGLETLGMVYTQIVGEPKTTSARVNDCFDTPHHPHWIDHVWVSRENANSESSLQVVNLEFKYGDKICPSSDHQAIEANLVFN